MILDALTQFADAESVANAAGTNLIGDVIDIGALRDIGQGQPLYLVIRCQTEIITGGAAGTIQFQLASSAAATMTAPNIHFQTDTFVTDDTIPTELRAGDTIAVIALPMENPAYLRYLGILAVVATAATTAGAIDAFLTPDVSAWKAYADANN